VFVTSFWRGGRKKSSHEQNLTWREEGKGRFLTVKRPEILQSRAPLKSSPHHEERLAKTKTPKAQVKGDRVRDVLIGRNKKRTLEGKAVTSSFEGRGGQSKTTTSGLLNIRDEDKSWAEVKIPKEQFG